MWADHVHGTAALVSPTAVLPPSSDQVTREK